ncbi:MAG TPA: DNA replication and repair protein RecF, partial [Gammaproteobacteria bacterium]|nr:DNA replication and repair protein RecF [Gammaproteobacteria bacterium]
QKLLVYVLKLAQIHHLRERTGKRSVLLLDDLGAELDQEHRGRLLGHLARQASQVFVTATEPEQIDPGDWPEAFWFHVEQGQIARDPTL